MTEINGLRLAYRGLITGLAGGWVWAAAAMLGGLLAGRQPLLPLEVLGGGDGRGELAIGMVVTQLAGGGVGMGFAYFFARYFTVRGTLLAAAPCFALLAWLAAGTFLPGAGDAAVPQLILGAASVLYGLLLGAGLPVRSQVQRQPSLSPST
ncbi:MAG TPA: hypothetical protein VFK61_02100 [Candidatus Limnocylindria bacterium]|nr:hypothetical protein [Candidatus Limnocylindria bacterium]